MSNSGSVTPSTEKIITLLDFVKTHSDAENPLTIAQAGRMLAEAGLELERNTLANYIERFQALGLIAYAEAKKPGKALRFYYAQFPFTRAESRLLRDALTASKLLGHGETAGIIAKLAGLASEQQREYISPRGIPTYYRQKRPAGNVFFTIDVIQKAMGAKKAMDFQYTAYDMRKQLAPRHNGQIYTASPHYLVWSDDAYYVITNPHGSYDARHVKAFRVDRILNPKISAAPRQALPPGFKIDEFVRAQLHMYSSGEIKHVQAEFTLDLLSVVIDQFGEEIRISAGADGKFIAEFEVVISQMFFAWLFRFGDRARILSPPEVGEGYRAALAAALKKFEP